MIYHPSIVAEIAADDVKFVLDSLAKLITTTKMKSVCNSGVWCISIQQLSTPLLAAHFHSLLLAIVHAIDNPIGSLSTTFEAIQAVMKLATLLSENMREMSHIWAPPVNRRLLSSDKRERDMSERCLLNTRSTILPPPLNLSKAVVKDLKPRLLTGMHHMLTNGMKVQTIQAWGWFICLLGSHALKNRQLINQMLKIPEQTFSDHDSQIQIASQVAWEGLVDALVHPTMILPFETNATKKDNVFQVDPDGKSIWARNLCVDLLNDFILAKCKDIDYDSLNQVNHQLLGKTSRIAPFVSGSFSWKQCPMKWFPWDPSLLDFHLKMIYILICQASRETVSHDNRISAADASLRLFRSVLKGVQLELKRSSISYDDIMFCLNAILKFVKNTCEKFSSDCSDRNDLHHISLQLVEAVCEEIEHTIVGSPLYRGPFDIKCIDNLQILVDLGCAKSGVTNAYMDMVSPMVYLSVLYFWLVVQSTMTEPKTDINLQRMQNYFKYLLSMFDPLEGLVVTTGLLYKHSGPSCLRMWIAVAEGLKFYIDDMKDFSSLKMESDSKCGFAMCDLLSYPLVVELEQVITLWKSLYCSLCTSISGCFIGGSFFEDLFSILDRCLQKCTSMLVCADEYVLKFKDLALHHISSYGDVLICILEKFCSSEFNSYRDNKHGSNRKVSSAIQFCLKLHIRYMKLLQTKIGSDEPIGLSAVSRVYSALAHLLSSLHLKEDILSFLKIVSDPLLQWLVLMETQDENTSNQFQLLWAETLNCLRRSQPPIIFDSAFLQLQAPILAKTLDHPNLSISNPTITFWNSTYGEQTELDYPRTLRHVLDKLWRNGRISLHKRSPQRQRCQSRLGSATAPPRYGVNAAHNRGSKRVELQEDTIGGELKAMPPCSSLKRKRLEVTEHQKEVRRAQQGRERDCSGHGPGIQTFTSMDFLQGNEDTQDNQDIQNAECILELLRKG
ncbi:hypothetical protein ACFX13_001728 [Malus domestica]